jgi:hypothetical protein
MIVMARHSRNPDDLLLDLEVWEVPIRLSEQDLFAHADADLRREGHPADEGEDE